MADEREAAREAERSRTGKAAALKYAEAFGDDWDRECGFQDGFDAGADWQREQCGPPSPGRRDWYEQRIRKLESDLRIERGRVEGLQEAYERLRLDHTARVGDSQNADDWMRHAKKLEAALAECREALADLRQNARCSTDPAFVRAFDAATAILARTAPEVGAASRSGGATPVDAPRVSGVIADAPSGGVSRSPLPEVVNGPAAKSGRVGSTVEDLFQALKDSLARTDPEGEQ